MKKILVVLFVTFSFSLNSFADDYGKCGDNLAWRFEESTGNLTISGTGDMDNFEYINKGSTSPWNLYRTAISKIIIKDGVTCVGDYAFSYCTNLSSISIPSSVLYFNFGAFLGCNNLCSVTIPNNLKSIGSMAFCGCSGLTSITIPNSVTSIGGGAFENCTSLSSISIPSSVERIEDLTFSGCYGLTSISIPFSVKSIGFRAFFDCYLKSEDIHNGSSLKLEKYGLKTIDYRTADGLMIKNNEIVKCLPMSTSVTIPKSVTSIGDEAFYGCTGLTSISIPNLVTSIGWFAFENCTNLSFVSIGKSVTTIGDDAFYNCTSLKTIYARPTIAPNLNESTSVFEGVDKNTCTIYVQKKPSTVVSSYKDAYGWKDFTNIVPLNMDVSINSYVYGQGKIAINEVELSEEFTVVTIPDNESISVTISPDEGYILSSLMVDSVDVISKVVNNQYNVVPDSNYITISATFERINQEGVLTIVDNVITGCTPYSTSVVIPATVKGINKYAFLKCPYLKKVTINSNTIISNNNSTLKDGMKDIFGAQVEEYIIGEGVTTLGQNIFNECTGMTSVTIPSTLKTIGARAFAKCTGLNKVYISSIESWMNIDFNAYYGSPMVYADSIMLNKRLITKIVVPENVKDIKYYCFYGWKNINSVIMHSEVKTIGKLAFSNCSNLKSIYIPKGVTTISESCFENSGLLHIELSNGVKNIEYKAFENCTQLVSIKLGKSMTNISDEAFKGCENIEEIRSLSTTPPILGYNAFNAIVPLNAALSIPKSAIDFYSEADGWKDFYDLITFPDEIVSDVNEDNAVNGADVVSIYNYIVNGN